MASSAAGAGLARAKSSIPITSGHSHEAVWHAHVLPPKPTHEGSRAAAGSYPPIHRTQKKTPGTGSRAFNELTPCNAPILSKAQSIQGAARVRALRLDYLSPQTSYRLDNCHCARPAKDSDEHQVTLRRRKTTTKRSQRREHDQLPHPWVHLQDTFHLGLIFESAPTRRCRVRRAGTCHDGFSAGHRVAGHDQKRSWL